MAASEELVGNNAQAYERQADKQKRKRVTRGAEENPDQGAVPVENSRVDDLPPFWDGTPGTLAQGMVCRQGKESAMVQAIVNCVNGVVILGVVNIDGQPHNIHISHPKAHPLAEVRNEAERRKLWEYDQL